MYEVKVSSGAQRDLGKLSHRQADGILDAVEGLSRTPRPRGAVKLGGTLYRIRLGRLRIIYSVSDRDQEVVVVRVAKRYESTYKDL